MRLSEKHQQLPPYSMWRHYWDGASLDGAASSVPPTTQPSATLPRRGGTNEVNSPSQCISPGWWLWNRTSKAARRAGDGRLTYMMKAVIPTDQISVCGRAPCSVSSSGARKANWCEPSSPPMHWDQHKSSGYFSALLPSQEWRRKSF